MTRSAPALFVGVSLALGLAGQAFAAAPPSGGLGSLGGLYLPRGGRLVQYSSRSETQGAVDSWAVPPGRTVTLVDHRGPGIVRRWWMTLLQHEESANLFRNAIVRCYWDGERTPSVEAPLSDFFGLSFGEWHDYASIPASVSFTTFMPIRRPRRCTRQVNVTFPR